MDIKRHVIKCEQFGENINTWSLGFVYTDAKAKATFTSRWVQRKSNLMFALSSDKNQRKKSLLRSLSFNVDLEWLNKYADEAIYLTQYTFDVPQDLRRN